MSAEAGPATAGAPDGAIRRVRLPADRRTPAAARAVVRSVLTESHLDELANEALLLTTELTTNAVEHARTELDIEVVADAIGLTVTVSDFAPGSGDELTVGARNDSTEIDQVSERGRGLLLVDHFASRWGTTYLPTGKGVWFRLDRPGADPPAEGTDGGDPQVSTDRSAPSASAMSELMQTAPDLYADDPLPDFATSLLSRVAEMVGAAGGTIRLDRGDGQGRQVLARFGRPPRPDSDLLRVPLTVHRPYGGELELDAAPSAYARPLAVLTAERLSLHLENDRLRRADVRRQVWLTFLAEASELLAQSLDVDLTMALVPQLVVPRLGQWCAVHTADEWGRLRLAAASHADESMLPQLHKVLAETGQDSIQARLREASRSAAQIPLGGPMEGFAVPLIARGERLGTLAVGRHQRHRHDPDEVAVLEDVARRAALAIENARIHAERRRVAQTLQQSLLPPVLPLVDGIGFAAEYVPTGDDAEVGGDFYDVVPLPDGRWLVVIGDVSGKGVQAAAVTGLVRDVIRVLVGDGKPLPEVLARLNETLVERGGGRYCTLALAAVGPGPGDELDVSLHLAGHDQPVLLAGAGGAGFVGTGGTALGLLDTITSPTAKIALSPGDSLIFYTDGVTERRRGRELFGTDRLRDAAAPLAGYSADVVAARLRSAAINFSVEPPRDDIAILVLRNDAI
ncbi:serine phosphatase RsbU (regulator of sigma subunit)/anti-sigma regulatory factor (Ser/Thr protein kinase) [Micromonospora luteifusca]|uniref:Serine phosphatase RsbU (Regulator of sigma subunit)/anti-sigma regulatory factor (Ser/Thr protein kinase) n=1 Tax=Micromonospora luteifusca TaxID=709860 RepID=A0ABS2LUU5_9ACTN|nr:SpoIIE family protein phosphatase [Micromonospora luteifusca]MBM7491966.1 serine phosphatase RsbU (regulator of sigma subunit)/anti-sigma regulatory factor (Ser/Thr protein kinase) [Micromonospora luteifusca]